MASSTKQVQVLARYELKHTPMVCYLVRSSNGTDEYCTTLVNGKATGCTCPARKPCYHMTQLEQKEAERKQTKALAAFSIAAHITPSVPTTVQAVPSNVQPINSAPTPCKGSVADLGVKGSLNSAQHSSISFFSALPSRQKAS